MPFIEKNLQAYLENQEKEIRNSEQEWEYIATGQVPGNGIGKGIEVRLGTKWMSGKERITHPEFRTATGIATGIGTGIGKGIEVGFKGRKKKDAVNDHILLRNKT